MAIVLRDFDTMVDAILDRIVAANVGFTDISENSVLRTIVESIVAEIDIQYYQLDQTYASMMIDNATGEDLDKLVSILGITRNPCVEAVGVVRFSRVTPATSDILIPVGTIVSTAKDVNGNLIEFATTSVNTSITTGNTYVDVEIVAMEAGALYVSANSITIMVDPIIGVASITNIIPVDSGSDGETDDALRAEAKLALAGLGKGTLTALQSVIEGIEGITSVLVLDKNRGTGTVDISVVSTVMPVPQSILDEVNTAIANTKSGGIDVQIISPTVVTVNITVSLTKDSNYDATELKNAAGNAIVAYIDSLNIGDTFVKTKMQSAVLQASLGILDISMSAPTDNVTATSSQIIRRGTITIDGVVWNG
jgi:uncharacterized phage protein gp47/JayE